MVKAEGGRVEAGVRQWAGVLGERGVGKRRRGAWVRLRVRRDCRRAGESRVREGGERRAAEGGWWKGGGTVWGVAAGGGGVSLGVCFGGVGGRTDGLAVGGLDGGEVGGSVRGGEGKSEGC